MNTITGSSDLLSYYQNIYGNSNSTSGTTLQENLTSKDYSKATEEELMEVCKEFEAYFTEQVIKQMTKMIPQNEESSTVGKYMDYFGDTFVQEIAGEIVESNEGSGLGIAQTLYEQMKRNYGLE